MTTHAYLAVEASGLDRAFGETQARGRRGADRCVRCAYDAPLPRQGLRRGQREDVWSPAPTFDSSRATVAVDLAAVHSSSGKEAVSPTSEMRSR